MENRRFIFAVCAFLWGIMAVFAQGNTLSVPDVTVAPGRSIYLPIQIDNTSDIVGVQFTLAVKEGITLDTSTASLTERADGHSVRFSQIAANKYMAVVFSSENKPIIGRKGNLMTIKLIASSSLEEGSVSQMTLTDVVLGTPNGDNIVTGYSAGNVKCEKSPDLEVSDVSVSGSTISPQGKLSVSWKVSNIGGYATGDGWAERIILETSEGTVKELGTVYYDNSLNAGGVVSRNTDISLPFIIGVSGEARIRVRLVGNKETGEPVGLQENNSSLSASTLTVENKLQLSPETVEVDEAEGKLLLFQLVRSGDVSFEESFVVDKIDDARLSLPEAITIPKGQAGVNFYVQVKANKKLDNKSIANICVSGTGYDSVSSLLSIIDDTYPSLAINAETQDVNEGGTIKFRISTERASDSDIFVSMTCDMAKRFEIPSDIKIEAGKKEVEVIVKALEDDIPNAEETVSFTVTAARHNPASAYVMLVDNDVPTLQLSVTPTAISEAAGPLALTAKLRRIDNIDKVVTVKLSDDSNGGIYYGRQTITLEKGVEEVTVNLGPIDNATVEGERTVNISAAVWIASCSCNANNASSGGVVSVPVTVYDNDGPTLTLSTTTSVLNEGKEMTVTVKRNTSTDESLTVNLSSDHDASFEYPKSVTIPTGKSEVSFTIKSIGNETTGDGFTAIFTATSDGYATGNIWFAVSDQNLPDAQITDITISSNEVEAGGTVVVETTVSNTGSYELPELTKVGIYISNSSSPATTLYLQKSLPVGETVVMKKEIVMPSSVGTYKVFAIVNDGNEVKELCNTNNSSKMETVKTVSPYSISIHSDKGVYNLGDKALISGNITGNEVSEKQVEIYVINDSYRHVISTKTDAQGSFSVEYEPYSGQMGHFIAGACYPKEGLRTEMLSFDYYGIKRVSNTAITCEALFGDEYSGKYSISNPSNLPLSNVTVEVVSKPENCNVSVSCPSNVTANSVFDVEYNINATSVSEGDSWQKIELNVKSDEGVALATTLYYYCRNKQGQIKAEVARINTTMIKGALRDYPFIITNTGKGETGKITLELPSWMNSVTPREMASLGSGDSTTVILRFKPTDDMQLNVPVSGSIGINCFNGKGLSLPFYIEPVSESTGTLIIDVCDENSYYTTEKPHVAGASVVVSHPTTGAVITSGSTGEDGKFSAVLPEGYYAVSVSAPNHNSYRNNLLVDPGVEKTTVVNLSIEAITVDWKVEETTVEDEYSIITTVKYETSVPVPVVVLNMPTSIDAKSLPEGESLVFYATLSNKGLITAQDVQLELPTGFNALKFEALAYNTPFALAPQQSVLIPVKVTHVGSSAASATRVMARDSNIDNDPCVGQVGTLYYWDCGLDRKWHRYGIALQLGTCKSDDPSTWDNSGNGSYGGGPGSGWGGPGFGPGIGGGTYYGSSSGSSNVTTTEDKGCEPCQNGLLIAGLKCASHFVGDAVETLQSLMGLFTDDDNSSDDGDEESDDTPSIRNQADGIYDLLEQIASTFDTCVNAQSDFDGVYKCYSEASKTIDQMFDDAVTAAFGHVVPAEKLAKYKSIGKKILKWKKWVDIAAECANDFVHACDHIKDTTSNSKRAIVHESKSFVNSVLEELDVVHNRLNAFSNVNNVMWGEEKEWYDVSYEEMCILNDSIDFLHASYEDIEKFKPDALSQQQFREFFERRKSYLSGNMLELVADKLNQAIIEMQSTREHFSKMGYFTPSDYTKKNVAEMWRLINDNSSSVCASITLQFSQKMTMTRQAFRGTLTVFNGHDTEAMRDVKLTLEVKDEDGNVATSHEFQINPEKLTGFGGELSLNSGWTLDAGQTGVSTILFIPTKYAASTVEKRYAFGGTLSYVDPFTGLTVTRILAPVTLTVKPSPNLDLTYFMQRDIKGDDPLTLDVVEPCEEAEFSLLINNKGYGDATNVKMVTDQPKIIENEKGLLVDFELMSSQLNGEDKTLALGGRVTTDFGTIPAMSTAYAQWWIKSSLLGHFTDYNVEATHVTSYDNPDLSLLNDVTIHELIRSVDASTAQKNLIGFMVNDIVDAEDTPDMMYLSDGEIESVSNVKNAVLNRTDKTNYTLTFSPTASGWNYGNVIDPTYGLSEIKRVVRNSDGKEIALRNFWQTDRTLRDGKDPLYENRIHFVDNLATVDSETYTITFEPLPDLLLAVASIEGVPGDGSLSVEPLKSLNVMFNKAIDPKTFTTDDITLAVQGVKQDVLKVSISTKDNKTFNIDFSQINETIGNGYFVFTVQTSEIVDNEGFNGKVGKSASWIMFRDGFVTLNTETYPKSAGSILRSPVNAASRAAEVSEVAENKAEYGSLIKMESVANDGYEFKNWTLNGEVISTEPILEYQALGDMDIVANFALKNYHVNIDYDAEGGIVSGSSSGYYTKGTELTFSAQVYEDWVFEGWTVNGESAGNKETLTVVIDGTTAVKALFRHDIYHQNFILESGWNWISTYLSAPIPVDVIIGGVTRMLSQTEELFNDPELGMVGNIKNIQPGKAYKVKSSQVMFRTTTGNLHSLNDNPVNVKKGWNWISYPYSEERSVNTVISNPEEGEFLVAQEGFTEFTDGQWQGTLDVMKPSAGYLYKSAKDKMIVFDFSKIDNDSPARSRYSDNSTNISEYVDIRKYPHTMNIIAVIQKDEATLENGYDVYAMVDNECRGVGKFINGRCYLTVYGEQPEPVAFIVKNAIDNEVLKISESLLFQNDVIGSTRNPFKMTVLDATGISNITSEKTGVKSIHNILGQKVKSIDRSGVYIIDGKKVVVTKKNENDYSK